MMTSPWTGRDDRDVQGDAFMRELAEIATGPWPAPAWRCRPDDFAARVALTCLLTSTACVATALIPSGIPHGRDRLDAGLARMGRALAELTRPNAYEAVARACFREGRERMFPSVCAVLRAAGWRPSETPPPPLAPPGYLPAHVVDRILEASAALALAEGRALLPWVLELPRVTAASAAAARSWPACASAEASLERARRLDLVTDLTARKAASWRFGFDYTVAMCEVVPPGAGPDPDPGGGRTTRAALAAMSPTLSRGRASPLLAAFASGDAALLRALIWHPTTPAASRCGCAALGACGVRSLFEMGAHALGCGARASSAALASLAALTGDRRLLFSCLANEDAPEPRPQQQPTRAGPTRRRWRRASATRLDVEMYKVVSIATRTFFRACLRWEPPRCRALRAGTVAFLHALVVEWEAVSALDVRGLVVDEWSARRAWAARRTDLEAQHDLSALRAREFIEATALAYED
jgi:hypothetical protein